MDFGDEPEGSDSQRQRKRYHRHTPRQIQQLEAMFKECPHPDENQRAALSRELGLEPRQIKFWFQNRRTQMKAQHERADNCFLRAENDKIRCENITMREALKNVICPSCGGPPVAEDFFDEQKLRMENARLKEELDRVSSITSKYLGRPFTQMPPVPTMSVSSLDLSVGGMPGQGLGGPSLDLDLLSGCSSGLPYHMPAPVTEMERPMMVDMATRAMDELIRLAQAGEQIWVQGMPGDAREVLDVATYDSLFAKPGGAFRPPEINVEGSRDSGLVFMSAVALVDVFMDTNKWMEFFPGIVSKAQTVDVLVNGLCGRSESLIMMYEELHIMTPVVPTRELSFLRYCKQIEQGLWAVADVSLDGQRDAHYGVPSRSRRMPSGCLIADMSNGYSKVTWVEHLEIEHMLPINVLYRNLVLSGAAFGAHRWLAALQRACERFASLATLGVPHHDVAGVTPEGKRSMMRLSQRMVSSFCASLSSSPLQRWTLLSGTTDVSVCVSTHRSTDSGQPNGVVLSAATSIWLPVPGDHVFAFVRDENARSQWDVLSHGNQVQEVSRIPNGSNPGNCISLLRGLNANQNSMLILQESCADASGALVVYSPIDIPAANVVMSGEDPSGIPLLPSGFAILPDGRPGSSGAGASSSAVPLAAAPPPPGCVVTVAFQILVSNLPSSRLNAESVATVNSLIGTTVQQIKAALNCAGP
ncbi:homeobox-leucine zipper protein ROC8 [Zea mays]|uniref:Homeodomain leucine zipper family IV protein n=1 Tax=Zea mays TaxID=4577 RepID=G2J5T1_MAIZE|nr:homeobox-leucine zipper protein ROC8 [Zea mays]XP_020399990.1 homeobox-leucine zipper protein ROC8 [Zea mays]DAA34966.1 TPA_exp: homeodomain leucine zipper family IV protein [Zea mays]|eukprot:XP_020399989.1 homeobox-leucine zipper protein ROC8 [Zea mays]